MTIRVLSCLLASGILCHLSESAGSGRHEQPAAFGALFGSGRNRQRFRRALRVSSASPRSFPVSRIGDGQFAVSSVSSQLRPTTLLQAAAGLASQNVPAKEKRILIAGAGPCGLTTAILLARRGYKNVQVFESRQPPPPPDSDLWGNPDRSYCMGISGRGQKALNFIGVLEALKSFAAPVVGRGDWVKGEFRESIDTHKRVTTLVTQRDRLQAVLLREVQERYGEQIKVSFGSRLSGLKFVYSKAAREPPGYPGSHCRVRATFKETAADGQTEKQTWYGDVLLATDGVSSAAREEIAKEAERRLPNGPTVKATKFENKNERLYKPILVNFPDNWRRDLNYSGRTKDLNFDALPLPSGEYILLFLFRPDSEEEKALSDKENAKALVRTYFPEVAKHIDEQTWESLAQKPSSKLPAFSVCGPELHWTDCACLLGDSCHTVKPYFGLGVNAALEDGLALNEALEETGDDWSRALPRYSAKRAADARALVDMSRGFDEDPSTLWGFMNFVFPLILDTYLNRLAPFLFAPNSIRMLQDDRLTFGYVQRRKRLDRLIQAGALCSVVAFLRFAVPWAGRSVRTALAA